MSPLVRLENFQQFAAINVLSDPGHIAGPVVIPSCAQIVLRFNLPAGKVAHTIVYGRYASSFAGSPTQAQALFAALSTGANWTAVQSRLHLATAFAGVDLRDVSVPNAPIISSTGTAVAGTGTGGLLPDESAIVVTLRTAFTGPGFRGRMYFSGWDALQVAAGGGIAAALMTALQNWAQGFTSIFAGQGYTWVLGQPARAAYTGSTGRQHPARAAMSTNISAAVVRDNHWDTQRRRGLK